MRLLLFIALSLFGTAGSAANAELDIMVPEYSRSYDPGRDAFVDGKNALQYARQSNRRVLIELGGNWCPYCRKLDRFITMTDPVKNVLYKHFVVLKINVSDENDNSEFRQGLPLTYGYPHIFVADSDGSILYSKDTTQLLENGHYSPKKFIEFLQQWKTPEDDI